MKFVHNAIWIFVSSASLPFSPSSSSSTTLVATAFTLKPTVTIRKSIGIDIGTESESESESESDTFSRKRTHVLLSSRRHIHSISSSSDSDEHPHDDNNAINFDFDLNFDFHKALRRCQSTFAAALTAGVLLCHPISITSTSTSTSTPLSPLSPAPAYAFEQDQETIQRNIRRSSVIDEAWTLVDKYYIDQTFHDQNWNDVRDKYESRLPVNTNNANTNTNANNNYNNENNNIYDDEEAMKLTTAMVQSLGDKYSRILDKAAYARIQKFDLIGVGATLMPNGDDKRIMVGAPPVDGSEALKGGIKYGDYITAVNGVKTEGRSAFNIIDQISASEQEQLLNNQPKTVTFTVLTQGPDDIKGEGYIRDVTMNRQVAEIKNPISYKITEKRKDGTVVGYARITEFNSLVKPKLEEALKSLQADGANAYVLDLRSNPGGAFQSAVEISSLFMDDNKLVTNVVDSNLVEMPFRTANNKAIIDKDSPLVLWIDGGSASASEVLAGALHDQCRAVVMGSHSFGKGLIQAVYGLKNGSGLVLTVAKYVTPNGTNIQGSGIMPDIESKLPFLYLPGSSDTSKVDFKDIGARLQPAMCPPLVADN